MNDRAQNDIQPADDGQVSASAAEVYEAFFVPAMFERFSNAVLDHAGVVERERVLDVGCGTGALARRAQQRVGPDGGVVGLDPNEGMLSVAARAATGVDWRLGAAESIPFPDGVFDHAIAQFAAMFFTDRGRSVEEMARVTGRGGHVTLATWAAPDPTSAYGRLIALLDDALGTDVADGLRAPFVLGETTEVEALLRPISASVVSVSVTRTARFSSLAEWVRTEIRGWTLADSVDGDAEEALISAAERHLGTWVRPDGSVAFDLVAIVSCASV